MNVEDSYSRFQYLETLPCRSSTTGKHILTPDSIGGQKCSACREGAFTLTDSHARQRGLKDASEYGFPYPYSIPQEQVERFLRTGELPEPPAQQGGLAGPMMLGFLLMTGAVGLVGWGIVAWTGSWWSIPLVLALVVFVALTVGKSAPQHQGKTLLAAIAIALLIMIAVFPAMVGGGWTPNDGKPDICQQLADGATRAELADAYERRTGVSRGEALTSVIAYIGQNCPEYGNR